MIFMRFLVLVIFCVLTFSSPSIAAEKEFGSIGAQVVPTATGEVVVLQLIENAPAAIAGLLPGDLIVRIDGRSLNGLDFRSVTRDYLWGFVGEPVTLHWLRPGEPGERSAELVRVKVDAEALRHPDVQMIKPGS